MVNAQAEIVIENFISFLDVHKVKYFRANDNIEAYLSGARFARRIFNARREKRLCRSRSETSRID